MSRDISDVKRAMAPLATPRQTFLGIQRFA
jgi:hypothetical protein